MVVIDENETSLDFPQRVRFKQHKKGRGAISFANHSALKEKYEMVLQKELLSLSTRRPGRPDACHLTDFFQTFTVSVGH